MGRLVTLARGFPGHPTHPPLTDVSIGAYTIGTALLVLAGLGVDEANLSRAGHLAISGGLIVAVPTALTGLLDWLALERGSSRWQLATWHLVAMVSATVVYALAWLIERPVYHLGEARPGAWLLALVGEGLLIGGGYIGGTLVYVTGYRVLDRADVPAAEALRPQPEEPRTNQPLNPAITE